MKFCFKFSGFDIESDSASALKEDGTKHTIDAVENQVRLRYFSYISRVVVTFGARGPRAFSILWLWYGFKNT